MKIINKSLERRRKRKVVFGLNFLYSYEVVSGSFEVQLDIIDAIYSANLITYSVKNSLIINKSSSISYIQIENKTLKGLL